MDKHARIYVAGHLGLAGSAMVRRLAASGYDNLLLRTRKELDLTDSQATRRFFEQERPQYLFLAAARVGGILANNSYPGEFIHQNLMIQTHVLHEAWKSGVERLLFLGSSCIYPRLAPQPMAERDLLTGLLEPTNRPYAIAKIAGIEMCWSYNRQYGTRFLAVMPTNLYGPGDNYDPRNSHVLPALIRRFHEAKVAGSEAVTLWGTGRAMREFLHADDLADAAIFLFNLPDERFDSLLGASEEASQTFKPPLINVGTGNEEWSIAQLATMVSRVVGFQGRIDYDHDKPDGTPRKLLDSTRIHGLGWHHRIDLEEGIAGAYADFLSGNNPRV